MSKSNYDLVWDKKNDMWVTPRKQNGVTSNGEKRVKIYSRGKKCARCKKGFVGLQWNQRFCSDECYKLTEAEKKSKKSLRYQLKNGLAHKEASKCATCGKEFSYIWKKKKVERKFCSKKCGGRFADVERRKQLVTEQPTIENESGKLIPFNGVYLTLNHYKEPLKEVVKAEGTGYYGALLGTPDGNLVQCHVCGELFEHLGYHINRAHKLNANDYKEKYELAYKTALCSENYRQNQKATFMKMLNSLSEEEKDAYKQRHRERLIKARAEGKMFAHGKSITLETKNKRGTCPDQLLDKIKEIAERIGKTPSKAEFILETGTQRYVHLIYKTYGSWSKAIEMLGMEVRKAKSNPRSKKRYSNEELLEYLAIYAQENNKVPTHTDFKRGLLPDYSVYTRRFGSIEEARQLAGVYEFVDDPALRTGYAAKYANGKKEIAI